MPVTGLRVGLRCGLLGFWAAMIAPAGITDTNSYEYC